MQQPRQVVISVYFLLFVITFAKAQQYSPRIQATQLFYALEETVRSEILDKDRTIQIYLPKSFYRATEKQTYPVIIVYGDHGNQFFLTTSGIVEHLSSVNRMPEAIVVSFKNAVSCAPDIHANGMWGPNREMLVSECDTDKFVKHLEEELFPYLKKEYRAADYRIIVGVSGSSVFPMHTFAKIPDLFQAHIILAGADIIGMGYKPGETFIDAFAERLNRYPADKSCLYFGTAEDDLSWNKAYPENINVLKKRLKPFTEDNLKLKVEIIPEEFHYDSYIKGLLSALDLIFPKQIWTTKYVDLINKDGNALQNIDEFCQQLSSEYGFSILPKVERWNNQNSFDKIGQRLLKADRKKEAIEIFKRVVEYRPASAKALYDLAKALKADGQLKKALAIQEKAITVTENADKSNLKEYQEYAKEIKEKITTSIKN